MLFKKIPFPVLIAGGLLCTLFLASCGKDATAQAADEKEEKPVVDKVNLEDSLTLNFKPHILNADSTFSAAAVDDIDGDGDTDIFCGGFWYENPSQKNAEWKKHFVREVAEIRGRFDGYSHLPYDIDGDGDTDFLNVNYRSKSIFWVEHPDDLSKPWGRHVIGLPGSMETGFLADVDADGKLDLLPNGRDFAAWFRAEKSGPGTKFARMGLPKEAGGHGLGFGDINGDGRGDIVGRNGWLEAPEDRIEGEWKWHPDFELPERASIPIVVDDFDEDGDADFLWSAAHGYGVFWAEQLRAGEWEHHTIDESWSQGHTPIWVDLDGNGRKEFVCGKRWMAHEGKDPGAYDEKSIHRYEFDPASKTWKRGTLSKGGDIGWGLGPAAADVDGDGDIDLVCPGRSGLYWLENQLK